MFKIMKQANIHTLGPFTSILFCCDLHRIGHVKKMKLGHGRRSSFFMFHDHVSHFCFTIFNMTHSAHISSKHSPSLLDAGVLLIFDGLGHY